MGPAVLYPLDSHQAPCYTCDVTGPPEPQEVDEFLQLANLVSSGHELSDDQVRRLHELAGRVADSDPGAEGWMAYADRLYADRFSSPTNLPPPPPDGRDRTPRSPEATPDPSGLDPGQGRGEEPPTHADGAGVVEGLPPSAAGVLAEPLTGEEGEEFTRLAHMADSQNELTEPDRARLQELSRRHLAANPSDEQARLWVQTAENVQSGGTGLEPETKPARASSPPPPKPPPPPAGPMPTPSSSRALGRWYGARPLWQKWAIPLISAAVVVGGVALWLQPRKGNVFRLEPGDCFSTPAFALELEDVEMVNCGDRHTSEVFHVFDLVDGPWPGQASIDRSADRVCTYRFSSYVGISYQNSKYGIGWLHPTKDSWESANDREVACILEGLLPTSGSAEGSRN